MFGINSFIKENAFIAVALAGLGVYSQRNNINLANNTTMLITFFLLLLLEEQVDDVKKELNCVERFTGTLGCSSRNNCGCGCNNNY